jgi:hypothetical protein
MEDSPCPYCGRSRERTLMSTDPEAPGLIGLLKGHGEPIMQVIAWIGLIIIGALFLAEILHLIGA